jgi:hypothetical protein
VVFSKLCIPTATQRASSAYNTVNFMASQMLETWHSLDEVNQLESR